MSKENIIMSGVHENVIFPFWALQRYSDQMWAQTIGSMRFLEFTEDIANLTQTLMQIHNWFSTPNGYKQVVEFLPGVFKSEQLQMFVF